MGLNPQADPNLAQYIFGQTGIPTAYTQGLQNLGFLGAPSGGVQANLQAEQQFQRMLKDIMDKQMRAFGSSQNTPNINALPYNMRSLFNAGTLYMSDPLYGIETAPGMLSSGYVYGSLPNDPTRWQDIYNQQLSGYANYPAPNVTSPFGFPTGWNPNQGGGSSNLTSRDYPNQASINNPSNALVGHYNVPLAGGGSMTVNASSPQAAQENVRAQGGNPDPGGNVTGQSPHAPGQSSSFVG